MLHFKILLAKKIFIVVSYICTTEGHYNMIKVAPLNFNQNSLRVTSFNGRRKKEAEIAVNIINVDTPDIHVQSKKLVTKATELINEAWANIKEKKLHNSFPEFVKKDSKGYTITLKPVYNNEKLLLLEVDKGKVVDKIFVNQNNPKYFKYEQSIKTDFGTATTKTYDSRRQNNNPLLVDKVNGALQDYIPLFLKDSKKRSRI